MLYETVEREEKGISHVYEPRSDRIFKPCRECPFIRCCIRHNVDSCSKCPQYPCKEISDYQEKYVNKCNQI